MNWWWGECPYSTKTREVLGNPSPPPSRFPSTLEISLGLRLREISRVWGNLSFWCSTDTIKPCSCVPGYNPWNIENINNTCLKYAHLYLIHEKRKNVNNKFSQNGFSLSLSECAKWKSGCKWRRLSKLTLRRWKQEIIDEGNHDDNAREEENYSIFLICSIHQSFHFLGGCNQEEQEACAFSPIYQRTAVR